MGRESAFGIATHYGLDGAGIAFQKGRGFPCRPDRSGAHPASYTMGTASVQGVKRPGREINHIAPSSAEIEERIELNHFHLLTLRGLLPLPLPLCLYTSQLGISASFIVLMAVITQA